MNDKRLAISQHDDGTFHFEPADTWAKYQKDRWTLCGMQGISLRMGTVPMYIEAVFKEWEIRTGGHPTCAKCLRLAEELRDPVSRLADIS